MKKYYIKIILGFRKDQEFSIEAKEAHKAYFLFRNPSERGTFSNGLALIGNQIQRIEPDYNATMGWNADYLLTGEDRDSIQTSGVADKMRKIMEVANEIAMKPIGRELELPLTEVLENRKLLEKPPVIQQINGIS